MASDKIHAKVIKEGKDVTLPRVMEIACLEVSTQKHIDRMQETTKVNYIQYGQGSKKGKAKGKGSANSGSSGGSRNSGSTGKPSGKGKKVPLPTDICWRCDKGRHQKGQPCKAVEAVCRNCSIKGHYEKACMKGKHSTHLVNVPEPSTSSDPNYFNEHGDPVCTHMVNVKEMNRKKHLIWFPISIDLEKVRNLVEPSKTKCPTVLLKADTGADVNLMNLNTLDTLIKDRTILQPSSLRMEAYGNSAVEVLGKFHVFLRWKGCVYRQLFYVTNTNDSPNFLSRNSCYTLGMIRPCYSVESTGNSSKFQGNLEAAPTQLATHLDQSKMQGKSFAHCKNDGLVLPSQHQDG